nr:hypothetical protein CFP56_04947 [Quercus suber]
MAQPTRPTVIPGGQQRDTDMCTRLSGSWFLFDDWSRNFCLYCLHSLLCCFLPQRQGSLLIPFQGVPGSTEGSLKM